MTATKQKQLTDKQIMMDGDTWPHLVLPVKRRSNDIGKKDAGVLLNPEPIIYHAYMYANPDYKNCPKTVYKTFDELIADEWRVD